MPNTNPSIDNSSMIDFIKGFSKRNVVKIQDITSQILVSFPLIILYEISIHVCSLYRILYICNKILGLNIFVASFITLWTAL